MKHPKNQTPLDTPIDTPKKSIWKAATALAICFALGIAAGFSIGAKRPDQLKPQILRENSDEYKFINPILFFTVGDKENFPEYKPLESKINTYISAAKAANKVTDVSVYFRNLDNETWTGINEDAQYAPSSMLKVAVLVAYLKLSETDPSILSKQVYYEAKIDPGQYFKPKNPLPTGTYSNSVLLKNMIDESDNQSVITLIDNQNAAVTGVYQDLHLPMPKSLDDIDFMSARLYSRLFRALYNGTYLTKELSETALSMLSDTDFNLGLSSGIPKNITISHKFGERTLYDNTGALVERQLHDCGIIYDTTNPYFLCVMTRGKNFDDLESVISGISSLVYKNNAIATTTAQ